MLTTYGIYAEMFGVEREIAEFTNEEDAKKAIEFLEKKYGGKYRIVEEVVFEKFEEFVIKEMEVSE